MKINDTEIDFYNQDEEYVKDQLVFKYKTVLSTISQLTGVSTKKLHEFNKLNFDMCSIQKQNLEHVTIKELVEHLNKIEEFYNHHYNIVFMP